MPRQQLCVDVDEDVIVGIFRFEEQQLGHDQVGHVVLDLADQEDHPLLQQTGVDVVGTFAASGLLDHHRHEAAGGLDVRHGVHERMMRHV